MKKVEKTDAEWKQELTPEQYRICRQKDTERPFTGKYYHCTNDGTYVCSCCGNPLFTSEKKYNSGTGWPSFCAPIEQNAIKTEVDTSFGMRRIEVLCQKCDAHLGHVFEDGPDPTGLRYCINSISLNLEEDQ